MAVVRHCVRCLRSFVNRRFRIYISLSYLICPPSGHINHSLFWANLAPPSSHGKGVGGALKDGPLKEAIVRDFGSYEAFVAEFNTTTASVQGSGWGWLVSMHPVEMMWY